MGVQWGRYGSLYTDFFPGELWERKQSQQPQAKAKDVHEYVGFQ